MSHKYGVQRQYEICHTHNMCTYVQSPPLISIINQLLEVCYELVSGFCLQTC